MLMTFLTHVNLAPVETDPVGFLWQLRQPVAITVLLILLGLHFPLRGVILMIAARCRGLKPSRTSVILCAVELALGIGILCLARFSTLGLYILLATYLFCILVAEAINCYIYACARQWRFFIPSAVSTTLGIQFLVWLLVLRPVAKQRVLLAFSLLMLAVFGASMLCDLLFFLVKNSGFRRVLSNIRIALPDYAGLALPLHTTDASRSEPLAPAQEAVEVLFQVSRHGIGIVGHCELCIDGRTLTYGCYDPASRRFFGVMGTGVIFRAPREKYLAWAMRTNRKKIVSYSLHLLPEQLLLVREQLAAMEKQMERWMPQECEEEFISRVQQVPGVEIFRMTDGPFRTYFIPTINCVTITNSILGHTDLGSALMPGVKTPGAYMDMLDRQLRSGSDIVVARHVYGE